MGYIFAIITIALHILYIGLLLRMLLDWVRVFVPPLRIGNFALDTGFLILILGVGLLLSVMTSLTLTFSR